MPARNTAAAIAMLILSAGAASGQEYTWTGAIGSSWSAPGNWIPDLPTSPPDQPGESAIVGAGALVTQARGSISGLAVSGATIEVGSFTPGTLFSVTAPLVINSGIIRTGVYSNATSHIIRLVGTPCILQGPGEVRLEHGGSLESGPGTIEQAPDHSIVASAGNSGTVTANLDNRGSVRAEGQVTFRTGAVLNRADIVAAPGGLVVVSGAITQSDNGRLLADSGEVRVIRNGSALGSITGGTLRASGTGFVRFSSGSRVADVWCLAPARLDNCDLDGSFFRNDAAVTSAGGFNVRSDVEVRGSGVLTVSGGSIDVDTGRTFTNAPGHTIRGSVRLAGRVTNAGIVAADTAGMSIVWSGTGNVNSNQAVTAAGAQMSLQSGVSGTGEWGSAGTLRLTGTGTALSTTRRVTIAGDGWLDLPNNTNLGNAVDCSVVSTDLVLEPGARLNADGIGTTIRIAGSFDNQMTTESRWSWTNGALVMTAAGAPGPACHATIEAASTDRGTASNAHTSNFSLSRLIIEPGARVALVDARDNGNRAPSGREAVYIRTDLTLGAGTILNLNGVPLYAGTPAVRIGTGPRGGGVIVDTTNHDCNHNGTDDDCDIDAGILHDADADGVPDECACRADWNHDGTVSSQDFFDFLSAFFAADADFNLDGATNSQDFFDFLTAFFTACG